MQYFNRSLILPCGNHEYINSPTILPNAAPALKFGIKTPWGIGNDDASIDAINW